MTTTAAAVEEKQAVAARIANSLRVNTGEIEDLEARLAAARQRRRSIILLGRDNGAPTYEAMAEAAGITKSAVYKVVRNGFHEPPVSQWGEKPAEADPE